MVSFGFYTLGLLGAICPHIMVHGKQCINGIVKICGVEKSPKIEKAEAFASVFRSEGRSPERRETDAARVAARRTQCVAGQAMVIMFAFAHSLYGTGGIPPGLNDVILILL